MPLLKWQTISWVLSSAFFSSIQFLWIFHQKRVVPLAGFLMESHATSSSTSQCWSGAMLWETAKGWEQTSPKSLPPPKISSSSTFFSSRKTSCTMVHGWDFTVRQTQSSTGQMTPRWPAIPHGTLVNQTAPQLRSAAKFTVQGLRKESGTTRNAIYSTRKLNWARFCSARKTLKYNNALIAFYKLPSQA